jgi:amphi-Trp domain-containing protein
MAEKNLEEDDVSRGETAERLRAIADELDGDGDVNLEVENKTISLSPPSSINYELGVRESSSILRGDRESVTIKLDWSPE